MTELESEVNKLNAKDSLLTDLLLEKNERTAAANHFESAPMRTNQSAVASINGLPSSCGDLKMIGHTLNGFYSIAGSTMIESVYCDFNKLPSDPGKYFILIWMHSLFKDCNLFFNHFLEKISRNGSDTSTSNRRPSISTSSAIQHIPHNTLQFRGIWRG